MMRQGSLPTSSSSRPENSNDKVFHAKSIGCMSRLIHLLSGNSSRRKFLTFRKKQEVNEISAPKTPDSSMQHPQQGDDKTKNTTTLHFRRLSCDDVVPRSPTLPAEIRRSNSVNSSENFRRTPPALVARLMGLEEAPPSKPFIPPESATEKRRKLLGALEKCDEDLKALKKIIDTVRSAEGLRSSAILFKSPDGDHRTKRFSGGKWSESNTELPSPVSVLEELSTGSVSPLKKYYSHPKPQTHNHGGGGGAQGHINQRQHQMMIRKKPGEEEEEYMNPISRFEKITTSGGGGGGGELASPPWSSCKSMRDSVEEVCRDIGWGQRREIGRIGLSLQDHICRDLILEFVTELITTSTTTTTTYHPTPPPSYYHHHPQYHNSLPFEACKRRLCF